MLVPRPRYRVLTGPWWRKAQKDCPPVFSSPAEREFIWRTDTPISPHNWDKIAAESKSVIGVVPLEFLQLIAGKSRLWHLTSLNVLSLNVHTTQVCLCCHTKTNSNNCVFFCVNSYFLLALQRSVVTLWAGSSWLRNTSVYYHSLCMRAFVYIVKYMFTI